MGDPRAFLADNGTEYSNSMFVDFCNGLGFVAGLRPLLRHNRIDPSAISRAFKAGHAARLRVLQLYPDIRLEEVWGCTDAAGTSLWLDSLVWKSECFNRAATSVNDTWLSPHEMFYGSRPRLLLQPFLQLAYYRVPRRWKTDPGSAWVLVSMLGIITGGIATGVWMRRRKGSLIRATPPGTTRKHRGSPRSGLRQQNRRGISTPPCSSLGPSPLHPISPRELAAN